jgi:hypothetical protein
MPCVSRATATRSLPPCAECTSGLTYEDSPLYICAERAPNGRCEPPAIRPGGGEADCAGCQRPCADRRRHGHDDQGPQGQRRLVLLRRPAPRPGTSTRSRVVTASMATSMASVPGRSLCTRNREWLPAGGLTPGAQGDGEDSSLRHPSADRLSELRRPDGAPQGSRSGPSGDDRRRCCAEGGRGLGLPIRRCASRPWRLL